MTALFDMDGTLFACDSQLRFARWILKRHGWRRIYLFIVLPCALLRLLHLIDTEKMKRIFLCYAWGLESSKLEEECQAFVEQEILPSIYPEVKARIQACRQAGHTTVLCSASPDWWAQLVGERLGFTHTIGTPTGLQERVPFMPPIPAPGNNKGGNKLIRLAGLGITQADVGYTDSAADLPMLSICRHAVLVNPKASFAERVQGAEILTPRPPRRLPFLYPLRCLLGA